MFCEETDVKNEVRSNKRVYIFDGNGQVVVGCGGSQTKCGERNGARESRRRGGLYDSFKSRNCDTASWYPRSMLEGWYKTGLRAGQRSDGLGQVQARVSKGKRGNTARMLC